MANFKIETLEILKQNNKTWQDVKFIQNKECSVKDLNAFLESMDFNYDDSYGGDKIEKDLVIVGADWWIERHEYDGASWWEFKTIPNKLNSKNVKMVYNFGSARFEEQD